MADKLVYTATAVVGMGLALSAASWFQSHAPKDIKTQAAVASVAGVEVVKVQTISLRDDAQAVGSLRARQSVMLRPELAGRISFLGFKDGAAVKKGQLLVQLDDVLQQADVAQAQAQVSIAQAGFKRNQELVAANFVAQQVLDTSEANLQVAKAQLALAHARLSRMAIRAPFDGVTGIGLVNVGDYVKDGTDLVNLEDTRQMVVDYRLPERFGDRLKVGQAVEVRLDALPERAFKAKVDAIDPLQDANGRSVSVRALVPNTDIKQALRSGMFARTTTVFSINEAALVVPEEAIVPQGGRQFVVKAVPASAATATQAPWVSRRQEVKLGVRRQGQVEITEGVSVGDTVVVAGQQRLQKDGTPLRIVALAGPEASAKR